MVFLGKFKAFHCEFWAKQRKNLSKKRETVAENMIPIKAPFGQGLEANLCRNPKKAQHREVSKPKRLEAQFG